MKSTTLYQSLQLTAHADRINVKDTKKRAMVYYELKKKSKDVGLNINVEKKKQWYKTGKEEEEAEELRVNNHDI
jgi:hypothetical protein